MTYTLTNNLTNLTPGNITLNLSADSGYELPAQADITVTGGSIVSYNQSTGALVVTGDTTAVEVTCEQATPSYPVKGDLITMTLGNDPPAAGTIDTYRVLSINGSIAEVVAMFDQTTSQVFSYNDYNNTYAGSALDTYLNTTWYGTLSPDVQAAIVAKNVQQYQYSIDAYDETTHASEADYSTKTARGSAVSRYVYALDVEDIEMYFGGTASTAGTFSADDICTLFWNTTSQPSPITSPWLRSAYDSSGNAFLVGPGGVDYDGVDYGFEGRPAFTIDLSKIGYTINA